MNKDDCVFCNLATHTIAGDIISENDQLMVVKDILPKAPVHLLVIPKNHVESVNDLTEQDSALIGNMVLMGKKVANDHGVSDSGYKLIFNVGKEGGQTVKHLHLHLLGGKQLSN